MKKYLLFIDTETTEIPKRWNLPYTETKNWPSAVQISWIVYDENGGEIKRKNFYINEEDFKINIKSFKIHRITKEFLDKNGQHRKLVLEKLAKDIQEYQPLITGKSNQYLQKTS